jgi:hypothetical protein
MRRLQPEGPVNLSLSSSGLEFGKKAHGKNMINGLKGGQL